MPTSVSAQYEWQKIPERVNHDTIVQIDTDYAQGTGVVIKNFDDSAWILTCAHVGLQCGGKALQITYRDGTVVEGILIEWNMSKDTALIKVPKTDIQAVEIYEGELVPGDRLEAVGLGGGVKVTGDQVRRFTFLAAKCTARRKTLMADEFVIPGDSGGPIFKDGKLVGMISAGYFKVRRPFKPMNIWGLVAVPLDAIEEILED